MIFFKRLTVSMLRSTNASFFFLNMFLSHCYGPHTVTIILPVELKTRRSLTTLKVIMYIAP